MLSQAPLRRERTGRRRGGPEPGRAFPVVVNLRAIGVSFAWWRERRSASRRPATRGSPPGTTSSAAAYGPTRSSRRGRRWRRSAGRPTRLGLMTFVANVMNRHPAVLARMAATLQEATGGRLVLGIGIGGHPAEHHAYGIPFPDAPERVARLEEAVAVLRALWTGGPVTRPSPFYPLIDAHAFPVPIRRRRSSSAASRGRGGARRPDRRRLDNPGAALAERLPAYLDALAAAGKDRAGQRVLVAFDLPKGGSLAASPWVEDPAGGRRRWREAGADGAVIGANTTGDVDSLVAAAARR